MKMENSMNINMTEIEEAHLQIRDSWFRYGKGFGNDGDEKCTTSSSIGEDSSMGSNGSSSDTTDDASSSASSSLTNSGGALCDLSEIMKQLPIKRGLSKFFDGKSESFTSLARVSSIEDLAKKATPYRRSLKVSKSCGNGLNSSYKPYALPKAIITKKSAKNSSCYSPFSTKRGSSLTRGKPTLLASPQQNLKC